MRDIKFRVWDMTTDNPVMLKWDQLLPERCDVVFLNAPKELIQMQYTGLKDKNGKEIYEGDWVECDRYETRDLFLVNIEDIRRLNRYLFGSELNSLKVIGNIYEHPSLLKE